MERVGVPHCAFPMRRAVSSLTGRSNPWTTLPRTKPLVTDAEGKLNEWACTVRRSAGISIAGALQEHRFRTNVSLNGAQLGMLASMSSTAFAYKALNGEG